MYCLTAKNRITKRWEDIEYFRDECEFDFMIDSIDYNKYSESMILDENHHLHMYYECKDFTPYFKDKTISKSKCLQKLKDRKFKNE